ncbi:alpha-ketoacid dehydrogenase subunit beta [Candidatus Micrarchaeota archaeon]|nr:alpha-ketoacid dehydrogenase subunit beta [Candidatus Micrarchaeota archaeon]
MPKMNLVEAINATLFQEMELNDKIVVMGEDVGVDGGVFRVTEGLIKKFGEQRVIDTPLAESGIIGAAIGMAIYGLKPVTEIQFEGFIFPAYEQIVSHIARIRTRSHGSYKCPIVLRSPYGGGVRALEHHSEAPETLYAHVPGLTVVIPSSPYDAKGLLSNALQAEDPVIFFEPKRIYRAFKEEVPEERYTIPFGQAKIVQEGHDVTIITYGAMVRVSMEAAELLKEKNISCEIVDLRTVSPIDTETIISSVRKTGRCVVVHEAPRNLGIGAEISARINEKALLDLKAPVKRVTAYDVVTPLPKLEDFHFPNAEKIINAVNYVMGF